VTEVFLLLPQLW